VGHGRVSRLIIFSRYPIAKGGRQCTSPADPCRWPTRARQIPHVGCLNGMEEIGEVRNTRPSAPLVPRRYPTRTARTPRQMISGRFIGLHTHTYVWSCHTHTHTHTTTAHELAMHGPAPRTPPAATNPSLTANHGRAGEGAQRWAIRQHAPDPCTGAQSFAPRAAVQNYRHAGPV
jgi:hypothetical protein